MTLQENVTAEFMQRTETELVGPLDNTIALINERIPNARLYSNETWEFVERGWSRRQPGDLDQLFGRGDDCDRQIVRIGGKLCDDLKGMYRGHTPSVLCAPHQRGFDGQGWNPRWRSD